MNMPERSAASPDAREELLSDIENTRRDLGDTVDQLAAKLDVKSRVRHRAHDAREDVLRRVEPVTRNIDPKKLERYGPPALAGAGAVALLLLLRRRRSR